MDVDHRGGRSSPSWEGRDFVFEGGFVDLVDKDTEEGGGLIIRIGLESGIDIDDEGRSHGGEQTGL